MIRGYLITAEGEQLELPVWLSWRLKRTGTVPCDAFEGVCLWDGAFDPVLDRCCRLILEEEGERRFTGVLDEYELHWGEGGSRLSLSARGMAAILLDNEATGQDYMVASLQDILRNHVIPYRLKLGKIDPLPAVPGFSVAAGSSEWQVLYRFARYFGGVEPRFDVFGVLSVTGAQAPKEFKLDGKLGVLEVTRHDRRFKTYSEILVQGQNSFLNQWVVNSEFRSQGGQRKRVITVPKQAGINAMRLTGGFQMERSKEERLRLTVTLAGSYLCEPGDRVSLVLDRQGISGTWTVLETESVLDEQGARVKLTLG